VIPIRSPTEPSEPFGNRVSPRVGRSGGASRYTASMRSGVALLLAFAGLSSIAFAVMLPESLFAGVGICSLAIVAIPWLLQPRLEWTSPWAMVILSVFAGATCTGICVSLRWPDVDLIDSFFLLGETPEYFVYPAAVFLVGLLSLTAGYYCFRASPCSYQIPLSTEWSTSRLYLLLAVLLCISLWATKEWIESTGGLASGSISSKRSLVIDMEKDYNQHGPLLELAKLGQLGFFILLGYVAYRKKSLHPIHLLFLIVFFLAGAAIPFIGSRRLPIIWMFIGAMALLWNSPRRLKPAQFVTLTLLALSAFQFMSMIRGKEDIESAVDKAVTFEKLVGSMVLNLNMTDFTKTAHVVNRVPDELDYKLGETLYLWFVTPMPRSLWPEKPIVQMYCLEVGYYVYGWQLSGVPPGLIGEMYWNFHFVGVVLGCFLFGYLLRYLSHLFGMGGMNPTLPAVLIHIVGPMRMGFGGVGHSFGYGFFVSALNIAVMFLLLSFLSVRSAPAWKTRIARIPQP